MPNTTDSNDYKTLAEIKEKYPNYNVRVYVGGYIEMTWSDLSS